MSEDLINATKKGDVKAVKEIIDAGVDINYRQPCGSATALIWAAYKGYFDVVQLLIAEGADFTIADKDGTPLENAMLKDHTKIVEFIKQTEQKGIWKCLSSNETSQIKKYHEIGQKVTRIFNFNAMTLKEVTQNMKTKAESSFILHFSDLAVDRKLTEKAKKTHIQNGGTVDEQELRCAILLQTKQKNIRIIK